MCKIFRIIPEHHKYYVSVSYYTRQDEWRESIKNVRVEDGLESLDIPLRGDKGKRRNSEIKRKVWKKYIGLGRDWIRKILRIKFVTWPLVPSFSPNG